MAEGPGLWRCHVQRRRHRQGVISGCLSVLPQALAGETSTGPRIGSIPRALLRLLGGVLALPPVYARNGQDGGAQHVQNAALIMADGPGGRKRDVRVLVVEDEQLLADAVATGLRREAMAVDVVYDGAAALERIEVNDYDVVVLDRDLPLVHGDDVCRKIVELGMPTRVLMLTASGDVSDRVEGLELGADDYLPKPFAFTELIARVRALGRRTTVPLPPVLERAGIKLDPNRREIFRDGREIQLAPKEFAVLEVLMRSEGAVVSAEQLLEKAWDENTDPFTNVVRVTVMTLRRKLGEPPVIVTVPGSGYRI